LLESAFLFIRIVAPEGVVAPLHALAVEGERLPDTEEVFDAVVADEGIALHVEEEIVGGRRRERLEAKMLAQRWQHLKRKRVVGPVLHLEPRLLAKPGERHFVDSVDRLVDR